MRGYAAIGLINPKCGANVGGVLRAVGVYQAALVLIQGARFKTFKKFPTDTMKAWKHVPLIEVDDVLDSIPESCVPVAVELLPERAKPLPRYTHPERALYVFGAEDATLGEKTLSRCRDVVYVPSARCMNLAATVNVVLYDRLSKGE